jgi:Flp pilus assembly pilin Flp
MMSIERFCDDESGAVTVDYVVLTAGLVGVGLAAAGVVSGGVGDLTGEIQEFLLEDLTMTSRFDVNRLTNASFEDIEGMIEAGWGLYASNGAMLGWTNNGDTNAELMASGSYGIEATDGEWMLDLESSPGNISLGQAVDGAVTGQVYTATFSAADPIGNNGIEVIWGGEVIQTITPTVGSMSQYSVELTGGSGNGDNMFYLRGTGPLDNVGAYVDAIDISS